jgi:hypothetical protein
MIKRFATIRSFRMIATMPLWRVFRRRGVPCFSGGFACCLREGAALHFVESELPPERITPNLISHLAASRARFASRATPILQWLSAQDRNGTPLQQHRRLNRPPPTSRPRRLTLHRRDPTKNLHRMIQRRVTHGGRLTQLRLAPAASCRFRVLRASKARCRSSSRHSLAERHTLARPFLQRRAKRLHCLLQTRRPARAFPEGRKRGAEVVLRHRPFERSSRTIPARNSSIALWESAC